MSGVWLEDEGDYEPPGMSIDAGSPERPAPNMTVNWLNGTASMLPTGVYTATGTPSPSSGTRGVVREWWTCVLLGMIQMMVMYVML